MARALSVKAELFAYDEALREEFQVICGVDEAGRGPLAGDVYAAAVILPAGLTIAGLDDSKKLTEKRREALALLIREQALSYCVASATVAEIEELNILRAAMLAMERAVAGLSMPAGLILVDGNCLPEHLPAAAKTVVHGDAVSASIAAASILAKTARDAALREMDAQYPEYGFAAHKGYGTKAHYAAIEAHGVCPAHRMSFLKKFYERQGQ